MAAARVVIEASRRRGESAQDWAEELKLSQLASAVRPRLESCRRCRVTLPTARYFDID